MKAAIVSPYFKTLGGGEKYALTFAQALLDKNWKVEITLYDRKIVEEARTRFGLPLKNIEISDLSKFTNKNLFERISTHSKYDLMFWVSDGSIPLMFSKKNILHFQIPFHDLRSGSIMDQIKFKRINKVVCNSLFTKQVIDKEYKINSLVWYPPIDVEGFFPGKKENIILAVGRFEKSMTEKRQDVLIDVFKTMVNSGLKGWKFVLSGGCSEGNEDYLNNLKKTAKGFPIEFKANVPFIEISELYSKAKIFWHAAGYGINEDIYPEKTEHFGMTTVEAMASGCVAIVHAKGGQKEIIEEEVDGFLWNEKKQLIDKTTNVITNNDLMKNMAKKAVQKSKLFSKQIFYDKVNDLIRLREIPRS